MLKQLERYWNVSLVVYECLCTLDVEKQSISVSVGVVPKDNIEDRLKLAMKTFDDNYTKEVRSDLTTSNDIPLTKGRVSFCCA